MKKIIKKHISPHPQGVTISIISSYSLGSKFTLILILINLRISSCLAYLALLFSL